MAHSVFCANVEDLHGNAEIMTYIAEDRQSAGNNNEIYDGFDRMATLCSHWDARRRRVALQSERGENAPHHRN